VLEGFNRWCGQGCGRWKTEPKHATALENGDIPYRLSFETCAHGGSEGPMPSLVLTKDCS
jgi:hypothetical protein